MMGAIKGIPYGFDCWNRGCGSEIAEATQREAEQAAYDAGWMIGLDGSGQAYYSCPHCASGLFHTHPMRPLDWDGKPPASVVHSQYPSEEKR